MNIFENDTEWRFIMGQSLVECPYLTSIKQTNPQLDIHPIYHR
jgi:hypothetical protein